MTAPRQRPVHVVILAAGQGMRMQSATAKVLHPLAGLAVRPVLFALLEWYRKSEVSSDRAGLLAVQSPDASMRALMHMAGGMRGETLNLEEFVAQAEEYREGGELLDSVYKVLNVLGLTHPFALWRRQCGPRRRVPDRG